MYVHSITRPTLEMRPLMFLKLEMAVLAEEELLL